VTNKRVEKIDFAYLTTRISPDDVLDEIVSIIHSTAEPDFDLIAEVGVGPLEQLFHEGHEEHLWPRLEQLARDDSWFRRALGAVWAFSSPCFAERERLLAELGEYREVTLRFVIRPRTFDDADGFDWRSYRVDALPEHADLASFLRGIARRIDVAIEEASPGDPGA
jgi:hypothetical protein